MCDAGNTECLDVININKDYSISALKIGFPAGSCEGTGGGGSGGGASNGGNEEKCVYLKEEIAQKYELTYSSSSGYFEGSSGAINPNAGLYPFKDVFVELNNGTEFGREELPLKELEIDGKYITVYIFSDLIGVDPENGLYIDLESGKYTYIPGQEPEICGDEMGAEKSLGDSKSDGSVSEVSVNNLAITFKRPDSSAIIQSDSGLSCTPSYAEIDLISSKLNSARVLIYPSGRMQIK